MVYVPRAVRQQQSRRTSYEREMAAMRKDREMVEVPFEWQTKQTRKAAKFPTYGWVPHVAMHYKYAARSFFVGSMFPSERWIVSG